MVETKVKVPLKFGGIEKLCGLEIQKATQIVTWPIQVKLGFMHKLTGMCAGIIPSFRKHPFVADLEETENDIDACDVPWS